MSFSGSFYQNPMLQIPAAAQGKRRFFLIAGPCAIESYEMFRRVAFEAKRGGATALRGGIFKMRTHSQSFQGLGAEAIEIVQEVKREVSLPFVSEITDPRQLDVLGDIVDIFQIGARNMHNYELLKEMGKINKPVLLKRGLAAYLDELLAAAEYIIKGGNGQVIFCERGIRTFERSTRNTLDLSAVPYLQKKSGLPVVVDPSHGTGIRELVSPLALGAAAVGADGVMVEVHPNPSRALSDGQQALTLEDFQNLVPKLARVLEAVDGPLLLEPTRSERQVSWMN